MSRKYEKQAKEIVRDAEPELQEFIDHVKDVLDGKKKAKRGKKR
jgi:hypothetical protein